jgi:hypothetical protein
MRLLMFCAFLLATLGLGWMVLSSEAASGAAPRPIAQVAPPTVQEVAAGQAVDRYRQALGASDQQTLCALAADVSEAQQAAGAADSSAFWAQVSADRCAMTG